MTLVEKVISGELTEDQFVEELKKISPDMAVTFVKEYGELKYGKSNLSIFYRKFTDRHTDFVQFLRDKITLKSDKKDV